MSGYRAVGGVFTISAPAASFALVASELRIEDLRSALLGPYAAVDVVSSTGSTNADLAAATGAPDRTVLLAEQQTSGRGRRAREWLSPPAAGLYLSVLLRPTGVPSSQLGTLAMVAGLALLRTARDVAGVPASLKWPNDLMVGPAKVAGVLSEVAPGGAVVVGIGLNVGPLGLDVPSGPGGLAATSLAEAGASVTDRTELAVALLRRFAELESTWRQASGDLVSSGLLAAYVDGCATLGTRVRVEMPGDGMLTGVATDLDAAGELRVTADDGAEVSVSAGDVVHLRAG